MEQVNSVLPQLPEVGRPAAGTKEACLSTGGTITYTANGLIHNGGKRYSASGEQDTED